MAPLRVVCISYFADSSFAVPFVLLASAESALAFLASAESPDPSSSPDFLRFLIRLVEMVDTEESGNQCITG